MLANENFRVLPIRILEVPNNFSISYLLAWEFKFIKSLRSSFVYLFIANCCTSGISSGLSIKAMSATVNTRHPRNKFINMIYLQLLILLFVLWLRDSVFSALTLFCNVDWFVVNCLFAPLMSVTMPVQNIFNILIWTKTRNFDLFMIRFDVKYKKYFEDSY